MHVYLTVNWFSSNKDIDSLTVDGQTGLNVFLYIIIIFKGPPTAKVISSVFQYINSNVRTN